MFNDGGIRKSLSESVSAKASYQVDTNGGKPGRSIQPVIGIDGLARLPEKTLLNERELATIFGCNTRTITRMFQRGELPPPIKFGRKRVWLAGLVLAHLETEALKVAHIAEKERNRIASLRG